ncbi:MAG: hypothetical protein OEM82_10820 [Acidobacteriota bacterium]|nr:hypothetical protein [Acidobacteriota bacterium]MDH3529476.1 hypothetical protein [Acidobacteriota bacterium]
MHFFRFKILSLMVLPLILACAFSVKAQEPVTAQRPEMGDEEDIPALLRHLPDWESKRDSAVFFTEPGKFFEFFRDRRIINEIEFIPGTEAVYAKYGEGELLIVEYSTPQVSASIDESILAAAGTVDDGYVYRRIGNYNVFVFDPPDTVAAARLLDQIKYEKVVIWPYGDPKPFFAREREFIVGTTNLFISTVLFILTFLGSAGIVGVILGVLYFRAGNRRRASMVAFSDAGGLTRLNLDGLTPDIPVKYMLKE